MGVLYILKVGRNVGFREKSEIRKTRGKNERKKKS